MHAVRRSLLAILAILFTSMAACASEGGGETLTWPREVLRFEGTSNMAGSSLTDVWALEESPTGPTAFAGLFHWDGAAWTVVPTPMFLVTDTSRGYVQNLLSVVASAGVGSVWAAGVTATRHPILVRVHVDGRIEDHSGEIPASTNSRAVIQAGNGGVFGLFASASTMRGEEMVLLRVDPATNTFVPAVSGFIPSTRGTRLLAVAGPDDVYIQVFREDPCMLGVCPTAYVIRRCQAGTCTDVSVSQTDTQIATAFGDQLWTLSSMNVSPDELAGAGLHVDGTTAAPFVAVGWPVHMTAIYPIMLRDGTFGMLGHDPRSTSLVHFDATGHVTRTTIASATAPSLELGSAGFLHLTDGTLIESHGTPDSSRSVWTYFDVGAR